MNCSIESSDKYSKQTIMTIPYKQRPISLHLKSFPSSNSITHTPTKIPLCRVVLIVAIRLNMALVWIAVWSNLEKISSSNSSSNRVMFLKIFWAYQWIVIVILIVNQMRETVEVMVTVTAVNKASIDKLQRKMLLVGRYMKEL